VDRAADRVCDIIGSTTNNGAVTRPGIFEIAIKYDADRADEWATRLANRQSAPLDLGETIDDKRVES
jgi:hypothetical protein